MAVPFSAVALESVGRTWAMAGIKLEIEAENSALAQRISHYLSFCHAAETPPATPHARVRLHGGGPPPRPPYTQDFDIREGRCYVAGRTYRMELYGAGVTVTGNEIDAWLPSELGGEESDRVLAAVLHAALRRAGAYELHAAGLVSPNGRGVLVVGPSGSGKSTAALQLAAAGWKYLSDDNVLLRQESCVRAYGLRRMFAASAEVLRRTGIPLSNASTHDGKRLFEPAAAFPARAVSDCLPEALAFSTITAQKRSEVAELNPADVMTRLASLSPWACYDAEIARAYLGTLEQLAKQARGWELHAGEDLLHAGAAAELFARLA